MMIHPVSDLHLETRGFPPEEKVLVRPPWIVQENMADVVVVAGDAHLGTAAPKFLRRFYPKARIVYVPGNHEYYQGRLDTLDAELKRECERYEIHFLQRESVTLDGVVFLGCTLWTDFLLFEPRYSAVEAGFETMAALNDYRLIRLSDRHDPGNIRPITWSDTRRLHADDVRWLSGELAAYRGERIVVVTHHAPTIRMTTPEFSQDLATAGFCSDLEALVKASGARYWISGHCHNSAQIQLGDTLVVSNPLGYQHERACGFDSGLLLEV